ncbi:MAG: beta-agarase [Verrucomicrobiota bacterium]
MRVSVIVLSFLCAVSPFSGSDAAEATGFVRVEQIDGVWWFIGPDGDRFVSIGVNHIEPHLWLAPYNQEATLARYGEDMLVEGRFNPNGEAARKWIDAQVKTSKGMHFNTFGVHTHGSIEPDLYKDQIYYVARMDTAPLAGWRERKGQGPRPDVFSEDFRAFLTARVAEVCAEHKDSRNLLGYLYTDVPSWVMGMADRKASGEDRMIYPWVNAILGLGEASPGKQRWIELLKERYSSPEAAAAVWGIEVSPTYGISWRTLARQTNWFEPTDGEKADGDMVAFMYLIADRWYGLHREVILEHDPNHLLLGDKNMTNWVYEWVLPALKEHVDVVAVQSYERWPEEVKALDEIYAAVGKPIFNGDGCFGFAQPEQQEWGVKGFRTGAKSFEDVAKFYRETLEGMMEAPYMVGWHHCGYLQQWDEAERGDSPRNENGFLDPFEEEVTVWTDVIRETNLRAAELHEAAGGES